MQIRAMNIKERREGSQMGAHCSAGAEEDAFLLMFLFNSALF